MLHAKKPPRSPRLIAWSIALPAGVVLTVFLSGMAAIDRGIFAILGGLLIVLVGEIASVLLCPADPGPAWPAGAEPADGVVGIAAVSGLRSEPNRVDPRWRAFAEIEPAERRLIARPSGSLAGRIAIFSLFVGRDGTSWSSEEIAGAHKAMIRAGTWVEREAIRWGVPANLDLAEVYFVADDPGAEDVAISVIDEGDHAALFEADSVPRALGSASRAASAIGFRDVGDLVESIGPRVEADARVWLLHLRRGGRSHAIPPSEAPIPGMAMAVCYARESNFPEPLAGPPFTDPVTVVHELLHLFGATDKYGYSLRSFAPKSVTSRDVMRLDTESLSRLRVDPTTAAEIGWAGQGPGRPGLADRRGPKSD